MRWPRGLRNGRRGLRGDRSSSTCPAPAVPAPLERQQAFQAGDVLIAWASRRRARYLLLIPYDAAVEGRPHRYSGVQPHMLDNLTAEYWRAQAQLATDLYDALVDKTGKDALLEIVTSCNYLATMAEAKVQAG